MTDTSEIVDRFWDELEANPFMMLGLSDHRDGHARPMTAHFDDRSGPIWFFAGKDNDLWRLAPENGDAMAQYVAKGHDVFACVHGQLSRDDDRDAIDRFWSPMVAAWYDGGKDDPNLALLRFDADTAKIWLSDVNIGGAIEAFFKGAKAVTDDKIAEVSL